MGCGGSRLSTGGDAVPAKLRPLLRRRIEEIRRHGKVDILKGHTLSKKELLKDGVEEDENSPPHSLHDNDRKSVSSPDGNDYKVVLSSSSPKAPHVPEEEKSKVAPGSEPDKTIIALKEHADHDQERSTEQDKEGKDEEREEKVVEVVEEEVEEEDEEEDGGLSNEEDGYICPRSPSFRVYYIESIANNDEDSADDGTKKELQSGDSGEAIESVNSNEGSVTKTEKKEKKESKFRKVLPKGGQGAVKNLLNVKSCYNPACSSHDKSSLLAEKAAAT